MFNHVRTILIFISLSSLFLDLVVLDSIYVSVVEIPEYALGFLAPLFSLLFLIFLFEQCLVLSKLILNFLSIFYIKVLFSLFYGNNILGKLWFLVFERRSTLEEKVSIFEEMKNKLLNRNSDIHITYNEIPEDILNINNIDTFSTKLNLFLNNAVSPSNVIILDKPDLFWVYATLTVLSIIVTSLLIHTFMGSSTTNIQTELNNHAKAINELKETSLDVDKIAQEVAKKSIEVTKTNTALGVNSSNICDHRFENQKAAFKQVFENDESLKRSIDLLTLAGNEALSSQATTYKRLGDELQDIDARITKIEAALEKTQILI